MEPIASGGNVWQQRVWLADDNSGMRIVTVAALARAGYEARSFHSGLALLESTCEIMPSSLPDLIISDIHMPELTGLELVDELRRRMLDIPVILMSAAIPHGDRRLLEPGICVLEKPFSWRELKQLVTFGLVQKFDRGDMGADHRLLGPKLRG